MSGDGFMDSLFKEAARLFDVPVTRLFNRASQDFSVTKRESEYAIGYVLWVLHAQATLAQYIGRECDAPSLVTFCIRKRREDAKYDRLVGDLVWFAMNWTRRAAA